MTMRGSEAAEARIQRARRGSAAASTSGEVERAVAVAIDRAMGSLFRDMPILKEKLEVLNGDRPRAAGQAAVRRRQIDAIVRELGEPTSALAAGTSPTSEEYNALVRDIHTIFAVLSALRSS